MRNELENIAQIEAYLEGRLAPSEKIIFEEKLSSNPELEANLNAQKAISDHFKVRSFKEAVEKHHRTYKINKLVRLALILLIAVFLLIVVVFLFFGPTESASAQSEKESTSKQIAETQTERTTGSFVTKRSKESPRQNGTDSPATTLSASILELLDQIDTTKTVDSVLTELVIEDEVEDSTIVPEAPIPPKNLTPKRVLWQINDQFPSYFKNQIIPFKITSKVDDLDFSYEINGIRGKSIVITLYDPDGEAHLILNRTDSFQKIELKDHLKISNKPGLWKIHIQTVGQGFFSLKLKSIE